MPMVNPCCGVATSLVRGDGFTDDCCRDMKIRDMGDGVVAFDCGEGVQYTDGGSGGGDGGGRRFDISKF